MRHVGFMLVALALCGCQTGAQYNAQLQESRERRAQQYVGSTMAQFMSWTGLMPSDAIATAEGKTFIIIGPTVTLSTPAYVGPYGLSGVPAVASSTTCRIMVDTRLRRNVPNATADDWEITSISRTGPCDSVL